MYVFVVQRLYRRGLVVRCRYWYRPRRCEGLPPGTKIALLLSCFIIASSCFGIATMSDAQSDANTGDPSNAVPVFLKFGKPITNGPLSNSPRDLKRYQRVISSFPSFESCTSRTLESPNEKFPKIDWTKVKSLEAVEVCVFRAASELEGPGELSEWLSWNEFSVTTVQQVEWQIMRQFDVEGEGLRVIANLGRDKIPISISGSLPFFRPHSLSLGVLMKSWGHPVDITIGLIYE